MSYSIRMAPAADGVLSGLLNRRMRESLQKRIEALIEEPEEQGLALSGELKGCRALRTEGGWCRIIYRVVEDEVQVLLIAMGLERQAEDRDWRELARRLFRLRLL